MPSGRKPQHVDSLTWRSRWPISLVRRDGCRHKPDFIQPGLLSATFGQEQMPEVDRIETAAEDAEAHRKSETNVGRLRAIKPYLASRLKRSMICQGELIASQ
jgi:hypothetical protein